MSHNCRSESLIGRIVFPAHAEDESVCHSKNNIRTKAAKETQILFLAWIPSIMAPLEIGCFVFVLRSEEKRYLADRSLFLKFFNITYIQV